MATSFTNTELGLLIGLVVCGVLVIILLMWLFLTKKSNQLIYPEAQLPPVNSPYPETINDPLMGETGMY